MIMVTNKLEIRYLILMVIFLITINACSDSTTPKPIGESEASLMQQSLYKQNCKVCHAQGINGAPILGNKKMWGPRLEKGEDALVQNAINGVGLMPAKGGRSGLTDEQVGEIVSYMLEQLND